MQVDGISLGLPDGEQDLPETGTERRLKVSEVWCPGSLAVDSTPPPADH